MAYIKFDDNGNQINFALDNNFTINHPGDWQSAPTEFNPKLHVATLVDGAITYTNLTIDENRPVIKQHYIRKLVVPSAQSKDLFSIHYKVDLLSGIRLEPEFVFTNDGFLSETRYYYEYNDLENVAHKDLVLIVSESYTTHPDDDELNPSERSVQTRTKVWKWAYTDGTVDEVNVKTKTKKYKTSSQQIRIGTRRRSNIIGVMSDNVGMALIFLGQATGRKDAQKKMRKFARIYDHVMNPYKVYADTGIYEETLNDTVTTWLDTVVPPSSTLPTALLPYKPLFDSVLIDMQGKTIRAYMINKFKGILK